MNITLDLLREFKHRGNEQMIEMMKGVSDSEWAILVKGMTISPKKERHLKHLKTHKTARSVSHFALWLNLKKYTGGK